MTMKKKFLGLMSAGVIAMAPMAFADGWGDDAGAADDQYEAQGQEQEGFDQGQEQEGFDQGQQQDDAYGQGQQDQGFDQGGQDDAYGQDPYGEEEDDQPDEW